MPETQLYKENLQLDPNHLGVAPSFSESIDLGYLFLGPQPWPRSKNSLLLFLALVYQKLGRADGHGSTDHEAELEDELRALYPTTAVSVPRSLPKYSASQSKAKLANLVPFPISCHPVPILSPWTDLIQQLLKSAIPNGPLLPISQLCSKIRLRSLAPQPVWHLLCVDHLGCKASQQVPTHSSVFIP